MVPVWEIAIRRIRKLQIISCLPTLPYRKFRIHGTTTHNQPINASTATIPATTSSTIFPIVLSFSLFVPQELNRQPRLDAPTAKDILTLTIIPIEGAFKEQHGAHTYGIK